MVVGRADARRDVAPRRRVRHRLAIRRRPRAVAGPRWGTRRGARARRDRGRAARRGCTRLTRGCTRFPRGCTGAVRDRHVLRSHAAARSGHGAAAGDDGCRRRSRRAREAALGALLLAAGGTAPELPPLLHRDLARRRARGGPRGVRRVARRSDALDSRRTRRRTAHRPPRRSRRPGWLPRPAEQLFCCTLGRNECTLGGRDGVRRRREDPRAR